MGEPYLGEIKIVSFGYAPRGWALCNGQLLPINQNQALFSLLGTTYGGDGRVNFALPDLRGRVPIHFDSQFSLGERGGESAHTLSQSELPQHNHQVFAANVAATATTPAGNMLAQASGEDIYGQLSQPVAMGAAAIIPIGGSQPHLNMQPFLTLNFIIALQGIFPSPN